MPVFSRPARVIVDEGGGGRAAVAVVALAAVAAAVDAVSAVVATVATVVMVSVAVLAGAGTVAFVLLERRFRPAGLRAPVAAAPVTPGRSPALAAGSPAAIEGAPLVVVPGVVLGEEAQR